jgi:hypothetical protein
MLPSKISNIKIFVIIILIFFIALLVLSNIFRADTEFPQESLKNITGTKEQDQKNVSNVFFDTQNKNLVLFQNTMSEQYELSPVSLETAGMHADVELAQVMYTSSFGLAGTNFSEVTLYPDPIIVLDDSGTRSQYYKFYAGTRGFKNILIIIPARKDLGYQGGIAALGSSDDNSNRLRLQKAQDFYDTNYPGSYVNSVNLITSAYWGEIIKLDLELPSSTEKKTIYLDYGSLRNPGTCERGENTSGLAVSDRMNEWEISDVYYRFIHEKARTAGINLSEPCSWDKRETMKNIFLSAKPPRVSPR